MSGIEPQADLMVNKICDAIGNLDSLKAQLLELRQTISQKPEASATPAVMAVELSELTTKNKELDEKVRQLEEALSQTKEIARRGIEESKSRASKLHKIILDSGLEEDTGPLDDEVERVFSSLSYGLFKFVMKYCTASRGKKWHARLPSDARNWYVVRVMASFIWKTFFHSDQLHFGFKFRSDDEALAQVEKGLFNDHKIPVAEIIEWRVRTCQLSKYSNPDTYPDLQLCAGLIRGMNEKLRPYWNDELPRTTEIDQSLGELCHQAYKAAMLFRRTKIEYRWLQHGQSSLHSHPLMDDEVDIVASAGSYKTLQEAGDNILMVFGEVIKADGPEGRISESWRVLRKCSVMLVPPEKSGHV